jgi:MSHA pilin protein MshA
VVSILVSHRIFIFPSPKTRSIPRHYGSGFTLIELVIVTVILGTLSAYVLPKFADLKDDATLVTLKNFKGLVASSAAISNTEILLKPQNKSNNNSRYNFDNGDQIRIRANYPDGRWNNTFAILLDISSFDIAQVNSNNCNDNDWCVRHRGSGWFRSRGYTIATAGRGFIIFPRDFNVNTQGCHVYYFTPNGSAQPATPSAPITGITTTDC